MKIPTWLTALLYPEKCVLCGRLLKGAELDLCRRCRVEQPECAVSREKYPFLDSWTALWYYQDEVRRSLLRYKFYGRRSYAAAFHEAASRGRDAARGCHDMDPNQ